MFRYLYLFSFFLLGCPKSVLNTEQWISNVPDQGSIIEVTDFGNKPRRILEFSVKKGDVFNSTLKANVTNEVSINGSPQNNYSQLLTVEVTSTVVDVLSNGDIQVDSYYNYDVDGNDPSIREFVATIGKIGYRMLIGKNGKLLDSSYIVDGQLSPQQKELLKQDLGGSLVTFPEEPLGIGASWYEAHITSSDQFPIVQRTEALITDIQGDLITVKTSAVQAIGNYQFPENIQILNFDSKGDGETIINLHNIIPVQSSLNLLMETMVNDLKDNTSIHLKMNFEWIISSP